MSDGMRIHIARGGQTLGPYALDDVRRYLQSGEVQPTDWAWYPGIKNWIHVSDVPGLESTAPQVISTTLDPPGQPPSAYHHVSTTKFVIYSICSWTIYDVYWFYRNWQFIRVRDGVKIRPFWRAIFSPLWCYSLAEDVATRSGNVNRPMITIVALSYFVLSFAWWLPDLYFLVGLLTFVPLLYIVRLIDGINRREGTRGPDFARVRVRHVLFCAFVTLAMVLEVLFILGITPGTQVLMGDRVHARHVAWMRSSGILHPGEAIEYFYSEAFLSMRAQGCVVTARRVTAYSKGLVFGELSIQSATYDEILDIDVTYSDSALENTEVFIRTDEDDGFSFYLSTEAEGDRRCVNRLMHLWKAANNSRPSSTDTNDVRL